MHLRQTQLGQRPRCFAGGMPQPAKSDVRLRFRRGLLPLSTIQRRHMAHITSMVGNVSALVPRGRIPPYCNAKFISVITSYGIVSPTMRPKPSMRLLLLGACSI